MHPLFQKRHSVRNFQEKPVESEKLKEILAAANSAPSAGNLKAREVVVISEKKIKEKLARAALNQRFISEAPIVLIFFSLPLRSAEKYGERGRFLYALQDATLAAGFAWLEAVDLGLAACWVGAFEEEEIKKILKIKDDWQPICLMPVGYEAKN